MSTETAIHKADLLLALDAEGKPVELHHALRVVRELREELAALRAQEPVGCMSADQFAAMTGGTVENGTCFRIWQTDNPPSRAKAGVKLYADPAPAAVPDGYVLVPKEPTVFMTDAGVRAASLNGAEGSDQEVRGDVLAAWASMLAAAQEGKP